MKDFIGLHGNISLMVTILASIFTIIFEGQNYFNYKLTVEQKERVGNSFIITKSLIDNILFYSIKIDCKNIETIKNKLINSNCSL